MEFKVGQKYNCEGWEHNPVTALTKTSKGKLVFEDIGGDFTFEWNDEFFQRNFTPCMQYPPCSLVDAEVGDTVVLWNGERAEIDSIIYSLAYSTTVPVHTLLYRMTREGYYWDDKRDTDRNARELIKAHNKSLGNANGGKDA